MPWCDTHAMNQHLIEISRNIADNAHAVLIIDQAGWHMSNNLVVPENITILPLLPKSPELATLIMNAKLSDIDPQAWLTVPTSWKDQRPHTQFESPGESWGFRLSGCTVPLSTASEFVQYSYRWWRGDFGVESFDAGNKAEEARQNARGATDDPLAS